MSARGRTTHDGDVRTVDDLTFDVTSGVAAVVESTMFTLRPVRGRDA